MTRVPPALSANCSPALLDALDREPEFVDAVKVSEFYDPQYVAVCRKLGKRKPLILHGICQNTSYTQVKCPPPGSPGFRESVDRQDLEIALELVKPQYISVHLEYPLPACEQAGSGDVDPAGALARAFLAALADDVEFIRRLTGLPVHLENTHFASPKPGGTRNARFGSDPSFVTEALDATGCRLLLDVAQARVSAWRRGEDPFSYVSCLPLDRVDEAHVSGPRPVNGELRQTHDETGKEDYALLEKVLGRRSLATVSLEYGGYGPYFASRSLPEALQRQVSRLRAILNSV